MTDVKGFINVGLNKTILLIFKIVTKARVFVYKTHSTAKMDRAETYV